MAYFNYEGKKIFYTEEGQGTPLIFLHGNTLSSKMFNMILDFYRDDFKIITIDFLGHGNSDRLQKFKEDFWYDEALQVKTLINKNHYTNLNVIGTSGGALAAINLALEFPKLVNKVIADSFNGLKSNDMEIANISKAREFAKQNEDAVNFWKYNHGESFENVINNDTDMLIKHNKNIKNYFHKDISALTIPILFTACETDDMIPNAAEITKNTSKIVKGSSLHIFESGNHPALISNGQEFSQIAKSFLK